MNVLFLGGLFPPDRNDEISSFSIANLQIAANNLQWSFINGLDFYCNNLSILTLPYIGNFLIRYKKSKFTRSEFSHKDCSNDICAGFSTLPIIDQLSRYLNTKKELEKWAESTDNKRLIIIYAIHSPFLKAAIDFKSKNPETKICLIVTDLPEYMSDNKNIFHQVMKKIDSIIIKKNLTKVDSFVLLTDYIAEALNITKKPWVKIEGIFDPSSSRKLESKEKYKTILYTGTLARSYGIMNLLEAFTKIKSDDYRLWICGEGDACKDILNISASDSRIIYLGLRTHEEVLVLQRKATVLINPRTSEGVYTKYSFPSKTMEYLASGTPTILHRLAGIPMEYFKYCYVAEDENAEGLKNTILAVCEKDQNELDEFGRKASKFILENKNPVSQVKKMFDMFDSTI